MLSLSASGKKDGDIDSTTAGTDRINNLDAAKPSALSTGESECYHPVDGKEKDGAVKMEIARESKSAAVARNESPSLGLVIDDTGDGFATETVGDGDGRSDSFEDIAATEFGDDVSGDEPDAPGAYRIRGMNHGPESSSESDGSDDDETTTQVQAVPGITRAITAFVVEEGSVARAHQAERDQIIREHLKQHAPLAVVSEREIHKDDAATLRRTIFCRRRLIWLTLLVMVVAGAAAAAILVLTRSEDGDENTGTYVTVAPSAQSDLPSQPPTELPSDTPSSTTSDFPSVSPATAPSVSTMPSQRPSSEPSTSPTSERFSEVMRFVSGVSDPRALSDAASPQRRAVMWLADEDNVTQQELLPLNDADRIVTRYALAVLYYATNGPNFWMNLPYSWGNQDAFLSETHECLWVGVRCINGDRGVVEELNLYNRNLTGPLPEDIGLLVNLTSLRLVSNALTGSIPTSVGKLIELRELSLSDNKFFSSLPTNIGNLAKLTDLDCSFNELSGSIQYIGGLVKLEWLYMSNNLLTSTIPPEMGNMSSLSWLDLSSNRLNGTIPRSLGRLSLLYEIHLERNMLSGPIPSTLSNLGSLYLYSNILSGSVPIREGSYGALWLFDNCLSGTLPPSIRSSQMLLSKNALSGTIPHEFGLTSGYMEFLDLSENRFNGTVPWTLGSISYIDFLDLGSNELTGPIPSTLGSLFPILYLSLRNNQFSGQIPSELGNMPYQLALLLNDNHLVGSIPYELGIMDDIIWMDLSNNFLTGIVPSTFGTMFDPEVLGVFTLFDLFVLSVHNNDISGDMTGLFCPSPSASPSSSPSMAEQALCMNNCTDLPGWYDSASGFHHDCDWYVQHGYWACSDYSDYYPNFGYTANEACCACKCEASVPLSYVEIYDIMLSADCYDSEPEVVCDCCDNCCDRNGDCYPGYPGDFDISWFDLY